jgi:hypothetical protein
VNGITADYSTIPGELLYHAIVLRLNSVTDCLSVRAVCKRWKEQLIDLDSLWLQILHHPDRERIVRVLPQDGDEFVKINRAIKRFYCELGVSFLMQRPLFRGQCLLQLEAIRAEERKAALEEAWLEMHAELTELQLGISLPATDVSAEQIYSFLDTHLQLTAQVDEFIGTDWRHLTSIPLEIQYFSGLKTLCLSFNQIQEIPKLDLPILERLDLAYNCISQIENLSHLTTLTRLSLMGNNITCLKFLQQLTKLSRLRLSRNRIRDASPITRLPNLSLVNLSENLIEERPRFSSSVTCYLYANPCAGSVSIRYLIKGLLQRPGFWLVTTWAIVIIFCYPPRLLRSFSVNSFLRKRMK